MYGNFLLGGMPFLILGFWIADHKAMLCKIKNLVYVILVVFGIGISLISVLELEWDVSELGIVMYATGLFALAVNNPNAIKENFLSVIGDKYSLYVYIYHIIVFKAINMVFGKLGVENVLIVDWIKPIVVVILSVTVSIVYVKLLEITRKKLVEKQERNAL